MAPPVIQALIWDVDGTLAETERDGHRVAFNQAFAAAGLAWHWDVATYGELLKVAGGKERIRHYLDTHQPPLPPGTGGQDWIAALHQAKNHHYQTLLGQGTLSLRPGVHRLLTAAHQAGIPLAIATTSHLDNVLPLLETTLGNTIPFVAIAAGDVVPQKKPAPDIYHYLLRELGLPAAACRAIEDSSQGYQAAIAAGIPTLVTINDYTRSDPFPAVPLAVGHLGEPDWASPVLRGHLGPQPYVTLETLANLALPTAASPGVATSTGTPSTR